MNSTPPLLKEFRIFSTVSPRPPSGPSFASSRLIVGIEISAAEAKCSWDQPSNARAAFIWRIDTFSIDITGILFDTFSIEQNDRLTLRINSKRYAMSAFFANSRSSDAERRTFIGGSDARIIMGDDDPALLRLWREKRGELEPE